MITVDFQTPIEAPPNPSDVTNIDDVQKLVEYLDKSVDQINESFFTQGKAITDLQSGQIITQQFQVQFSAPLSPKKGWVAYADGSLWNPGAGEGLYVYKSDNAWHKIA